MNKSSVRDRPFHSFSARNALLQPLNSTLSSGEETTTGFRLLSTSILNLRESSFSLKFIGIWKEGTPSAFSGRTQE